MWGTSLQVTVCLATLLHLTYPQIPPNHTPSDRVYNCSANGCGGQCMKGYCPYPYAHVNTDLCYCPDGMKCCKQRSVTTRCSQCSPMYRCVSDKVFCASPVVLRTCTCPKGQKCCKGPFCSECNGACMKSCQHPFYQIIHQKCPCPVGMMCCREATCGKTCTNAKCVPEKSECRSPALNAKCTCPPGQKCCTLSPCLYKPCIKTDTCKTAGGQPLPANDCPNGQVCCKGACNCQHGPCTKMDMCVKLGGTIIPSLNCLNDTVCCMKGCTTPSPTTLGQCKKWLLLGPTTETKSVGLHGLDLQVGGTSLTTGPNGLKAWIFNGKNTGVTVQSAGQLNLGKGSFTIATYVYQDVLKDGPIVNWKQKVGVWGTHLFIYRGKLYADLDPGKASMPTAALVKQWVFAGVSFNRATGMMLLWYGTHAVTFNVEKADKDTGGSELYVGFNRYTTGSISRFTGKLAGTTVMDSYITKEQIPALEKLVIDIAKPAQCQQWVLLGPSTENKPAGLHGLGLQVHGTSRAAGPNGLKAWVFDGLNDGVTIQSDGGLGDVGKGSFTIATYVYQDVVREGPIVNWKQKAGNWGTLLWIAKGKLYADLDPGLGTTPSALAKKWVFAGVSFRHTTGTMLLWYGADVHTFNVGKAAKDTGGAVLYVGFTMYNNGLIRRFTGKLAGTTVTNCSISKEQIPTLEKLVIDIAQPVQCKQWLLLGPTAETKPAGLHGLDLQVGGTSLTTGPNGLKAWVFNGKSNGVTVKSAGQLNLGKDSFTIATYVYQDVVKDGPIINWKYTNGRWGTLLWISRGKLYADLDPGNDYLPSAALAKQWVFAGASYRHNTGKMLLWYGANVYTSYVGKADKNTGGSVLYVGFNLYSQSQPAVRFTGKLAGTTVMNCSITKEQIPALEKNIINIAKPGHCKMWLILGPTLSKRPLGLHGLEMNGSVASKPVSGPNGLKAWAFNGNSNGITVKSAGQLDLGKGSFTIATFVYQDVVRDGPIVNWKQKVGVWGTHLVIYRGKLYADLDPGKASMPSAALAKQWVFAGVSFNRATGTMLLWYGAHAVTFNVGKADKDTGGSELYVGFNKYRTGSISRFTGKLAGTTVMNCYITKEQIPALEKRVIEIAKPGDDTSTMRDFVFF